MVGHGEPHLREQGAALEEAVRTAAQARRDDAAAKGPRLVDHLDVRGGAQVDHHHRRAVKRHGRHGVCHAVCAHLRRVVVVHGQAALDAGAHHHGALAAHALGHLGPGGCERGHHAGDDGVVDAGQLQAAQGELGEQHLMELVGGVCRAGGDCPAHPHLAVLEEACGGLGVADVDCKKHGIPPGGAARVHVGSMVPHDGSSTVTKPLREGTRMTQ